MLDLVGNPEDRFSRVAAQMIFAVRNTVNLEMFVRTKFSLIFANSLPRENKVLANKELQ